MKVTATRAVYVDGGLLGPGDTAEVDGRKYGNGHPFIKAGYLVTEKAEEKPKRKAKVDDKGEGSEVSETQE